MRLYHIATIAGALMFTFAPLHAKTHCKTGIRYSKFYNHPAYIQGFDDGYDGLEYCNPYYYEDKLLYDMGFEDGDQAYLNDNLRYRSKRICF